MKRGTKIGLAVAGVTAAAAAAAARLAARTNDVPSMATERAEPALEPGIDAGAFAANLGAAIRISTVSYQERDRNDPADMLALHRFLAETFPLTHERCDVETVNDLSLLLTWHGSDASLDPLVLMAHMDVVPVEEGTEADWTHPPFSGEVADDRVWGRGALDDKGELIAILEAVEHLMKSGFEPQRTVLLAFGHDEEIGGGQGAARTADLLRDRGVTPWLVLDEGGFVADDLPPITDSPVALVKTTEKGYVDVKLTAAGTGGHSSTPPKSTAVGLIAEAVRKLETNHMRAHPEKVQPTLMALRHVMDPKAARLVGNPAITGPMIRNLFGSSADIAPFVRTTGAVTMVSGGMKPNVLPQQAWAVVNYRIMPGDTVASVLDHVRSVVGEDITVETYGEMQTDPSPVSDTDSAAYRILRHAIEEAYPVATVAPWVLIGATDSRYFTPICDQVYGFAPFSIASDFAGFHGTDESMRIDDAERAVSFFARLIRHAQPG